MKEHEYPDVSFRGIPSRSRLGSLNNDVNPIVGISCCIVTIVLLRYGSQVNEGTMDYIYPSKSCR